MEEHNEQPDSTTTKSKSRHYSIRVIIMALIIAAFVVGVGVGELRPQNQKQNAAPTQIVNIEAQKPNNVSSEIDFNRFWEIWKIIRSRYVKQPVNEVDLFYGAVAGLVGSLDDPYSVFLDPKFAEMFQSELSGTFEGIGAEIGIKKDQLRIIAPLPDTPAERAGLMASDAILAIDGTDTYGMSTDEAVRRIRGPKGTEVKLLIGRGDQEAQEIPIIRSTISVDPVRWRLEDYGTARLAVVEIYHFNEQTRPMFEEAVQSILIENPNGLILDLRNNPGGFLDTAIDVAGEWIQHDVVVQEKFSDGSVRNYLSDGNARLTDLPTVVLVNSGSASASEIVAGALQHYRLATIIGEQTFGKGSVQDYVEFDDGSALKLTIALWLTPAGRSIEQEGITPDEIVELTMEDFNHDRDPQMERAVEVLK
ncbi:S41 family peptidase [Patescibacteria group bacterium]|nr:S41 family peptidase [Patescibacteria group bacterium]MBU1029542.1 S41 family peptidase [Patescibacteria group bacterium]